MDHGHIEGEKNKVGLKLKHATIDFVRFPQLLRLRSIFSTERFNPNQKKSEKKKRSPSRKVSKGKKCFIFLNSVKNRQSPYAETGQKVPFHFITKSLVLLTP